MGVVSFLNTFNSNKLPTNVFSEKLLDAEQALDMVFRTIALEKNQMFYPLPVHSINHKEQQVLIVSAAKKLAVSLQWIADNQTKTPAQTTPALDLTNTIAALDNALTAYQSDKQALPQLLLVCSSVKGFLQRIIK